MSYINTLDIYINSSNRNSLCMLECDLPTGLSTVTKVSVELVDGTIIDSEKFPSCFVWHFKDDKKCVIEFYLGREDIGVDNGIHNADLFLHDEYNWQGAWFGKLRLNVYNRV